MPPPESGDALLDLARKSGVIESARLDHYLKQIATDGPFTAKSLAKRMVTDGMLSGFQAEQLLEGRWKRFFIGKYKVLERLGRGGMANVFLCEHTIMRRRVAVKVLPVHAAHDPSSRERFYREARAVAALDHPNLVRAYDIGDDDNLHFLVMEYVDGMNLHDLVRRSGPLDAVRAAHYVAGAAIGLQHAHETGLVHRDIKPGNILVDRAGVVKVLDLGLALFFYSEADDQLTTKYEETVLGTADYLAPEQAIDSHRVDIRADIYSLGGTFYFLLTGRPPFPEGNVTQKLLAHQQREPVPILELQPQTPPGLVAIFERMTKKDANARYQTPAEVVSALAPWTMHAIDPPTESELPQFSLASKGPSSTVPRSQAGSALSITASPVAPPIPSVPPATPPPEHDIWGTITAEPAEESFPLPSKRKVPSAKRFTRHPPNNQRIIVIVTLTTLVCVLLIIGVLIVTREEKSTRTLPTKALKIR